MPEIPASERRAAPPDPPGGAGWRGFLGQFLARQPWLYTLVAVALVVITEQVIEGYAQGVERERERSAAFEELASVRSRLESVVNANVLLVHAMGVLVQSHPDLDQVEFGRVAQGLVGERHALRAMAAAPGMVVALIHPLEGNAAVLGLDYRSAPAQRELAMRAVRSHQPVLAGPINLVQGGVGFVAREAVYLPPSAPAGEPRVWGVVSGVMDADELYRLAGLIPANPEWRLALREGATGQAPGTVFFGDPALFSGDAVHVDVRFEGGSWVLAGAPAHRWAEGGTGLHQIRLLGVFSALLVGLLAWRVSRAAGSLGATLARLRTLLDNLPDLVWMKDPKGGYLACNRSFEEVAGMPEAALLGLSDRELFEAAQAEQFVASDRLVIERDAQVRVEAQVMFRRDQRSHLLETVKAPVRDPRGRLLGVLGIARDITERREIERRARMSDLVLDSVFQAIPDLFFLMDPDGTVRDYRAQRNNDLYAEPAQFLGRRMEEVLPPGPAAQLAAALDALAGGGGLITYEYDLELPHGVRHFEARLSRVPDSRQVLAVVRDVSTQHQVNVALEERVRERTAEIAAVNRQLETFAYLVSHDLKAPLRGIDGYSRLLLDGHAAALDEEARGFLGNIRQGVARMSDLIEDLLEYSRAERRTFNGSRLDLAVVVREVLAGWDHELRKRNASVTVAVEGIWVSADPEGVKMVLGNLIDNALKFCSNGVAPVIEIRAERRESRVLVSVHDHGIGFDMRFHQRIFEIFQRLQRSEEFPGTGVGLAIVHKAMERMGGRVWAESTPGAGATFFLDLPG